MKHQVETKSQHSTRVFLATYNVHSIVANEMRKWKPKQSKQEVEHLTWRDLVRRQKEVEKAKRLLIGGAVKYYIKLAAE